jgi:hypothetical protein
VRPPVSAARGTETYLLLWLRLVAVVDTWRVSVKVVVG